MSLFSSIKCIFCLVKCSKYLYYIKKAVCFLTVAVAVVTCLTLAKGDGKMIRYFRGLI